MSPATKYNHLNSDEANQNLNAFIFFSRFATQLEWLLLLTRMTFSYKILEDKKRDILKHLTKS